MKTLILSTLFAFSALAADTPKPTLTGDQFARINLAAKDAEIARLSSQVAELTRQLVLAQACADAKIPIESCQIGNDGTITTKPEPPKNTAQ